MILDILSWNQNQFGWFSIFILISYINIPANIYLFKINNRNDCNWTRTQNHLVRNRTLNRLVKWLSVDYKLSGSGFESSSSHLNFSFAPASSKEFLGIQATIECGFTLKRVRDMTRIYNNRNTWERCEICSKLTMKTPKRHLLTLINRGYCCI